MGTDGQRTPSANSRVSIHPPHGFPPSMLWKAPSNMGVSSPGRVRHKEHVRYSVFWFPCPPPTPLHSHPLSAHWGGRCFFKIQIFTHSVNKKTQSPLSALWALGDGASFSSWQLKKGERESANWNLTSFLIHFTFAKSRETQSGLF